MWLSEYRTYTFLFAHSLPTSNFLFVSFPSFVKSSQFNTMGSENPNSKFFTSVRCVSMVSQILRRLKEIRESGQFSFTRLTRRRRSLTSVYPSSRVQGQVLYISLVPITLPFVTFSVGWVRLIICVSVEVVYPLTTNSSVSSSMVLARFVCFTFIK